MITYQLIRTAFESTNLQPVTGYIRGEGQACALGALYAHENGIDRLNNDEDGSIYKYFESKYGQEYIRGFWFGFDNYPIEFQVGTTFQYRLGYRDGRKIGIAIFIDKALTKESKQVG